MVLGAETILGPLYIGYGFAEDDRDTYFLFLGQGFRKAF